MASQLVGSVSSLRRYPVKSMLGEEITSAVVEQRGLAGDRAHALLDEETQKVISVKRPRRWGGMFELSATTEADGKVTVSFPSGESLALEDPALVDHLSTFFGRRVSVISTPPPDASFDEAWVRDLKEEVEPYYGIPSRIEEGDELIDAGTFMNTNDNLFNLGAVHIVTTGTSRRLAELSPSSRFDPHRFRPNIVIETDDDGFVETAWPGCTLEIRDVRLAVWFNVPRCVMTTLAQGDLPADSDVLRTITRHNSLDALGTGTRYPCVGVYANVDTGGAIQVDDAVRLRSPQAEGIRLGSGLLA